MKLTCLHCLDGQHRRCKQRDCACSICAIGKPRKLKGKAKPKPKASNGPRKKYDGPRDWSTNKPMTEAEKDEVAEAILKLYKGFVQGGYYSSSFDRRPKKDHAGGVTQEEGDYICSMVVKLLQGIKEKQLG